MLEKRVFLIVIALAGSCMRPSSHRVPTQPAVDIRIDGRFDAAEGWGQAKKIRLASHCTLYLLQDDKYLFLGIKNDESVPRYVDLYLNNDSIGTLNLHASMQLGERQLGAYWNDTIPAWSFGNNERWVANTAALAEGPQADPSQIRIKLRQDYEFRISKSRLGKGEAKLRVALGDFSEQFPAIVFPAGAEQMKTKGWYRFTLASPTGDI